MWVDDGGLIFYLVYEFERLRLYRVSTVPSQTTVRVQTEQNNARAGFAPDELSGSGTTQPRPCILSFNTFVTDKGRYDRSLARSAWNRTSPMSRPVGYGPIRLDVRTDSMIGVTEFQRNTAQILMGNTSGI